MNPERGLPEGTPQWDVFFDSFHYRVAGPYLLPTVILAHAGALLVSRQ